jgi:cell division septation protein DedD
VIVRSTLPAESAQPLPANTSIDSSLQPIALAPPSGASLNRNNPNRNNPIRTNIPVAIPPSGTNINSPTNGTTINGNRTILITRAQPSAFTPTPIPSIPSIPTPVLRYRVVVPTNAASKVEIRRIVPTAFTARMNGQEVIQVGAYSDLTGANEQVKLLAQAGFNAEIESINPQ